MLVWRLGDSLDVAVDSGRWTQTLWRRKLLKPACYLLLPSSTRTRNNRTPVDTAGGEAVNAHVDTAITPAAMRSFTEGAVQTTSTVIYPPCARCDPSKPPRQRRGQTTVCNADIKEMESNAIHEAMCASRSNR